ncbi:hypothetical protein FGG08_006999 [Glutinoglossum americanum]|uniref:Uncharacterized protein n=1 Tax=Glutinoglossum americanum TaxID=1670608 RepID=A0A9P8HUV5_9PEZI|nr:hypothetical protein FGG08_006999 [Glutinoglossum americanum]
MNGARADTNTEPYGTARPQSTLTGAEGCDKSIHASRDAMVENPVDRPVGLWDKYSEFLLLISTTVMSSILVASNAQHWTVSGRLYSIIAGNRASVQIVVQIISNLLGLAQVTVLCRLINFATRLYFARSPVSLDIVRLWTALCTPQMSWRLPSRLAIPLLAFVILVSLPPALWAGAITPVAAVGLRHDIINIPDYSNMGLIREYPAEVSGSTQTLRNTKGLFTYSVGVELLGSLLSSAASATALDGNPRQHSKLDNTRLTYHGRSYGVGASVGLVDDSLLKNPFTASYTYQENGYDALVACSYNSSAEFTITPTGDNFLYAAAGTLPNSDGAPEYSVYLGHGSSAIVAIGVSRAQSNPGRFMGIATGDSYATLNTTQCSVDFVPALFSVSVGVLGRNITVAKVPGGADIDPSRNLTYVTMRQLEIISNDQTSFYRSVVGDTLNASIANYKTSMANSKNRPSEAEATLAGLTNSVTALIDDILVGYASAQLMVGNFSTGTSVSVKTNAVQFGSSVYIYAVLTVNILIIILVTVEAIRTRGWRGLLPFDYADPGSLITSASMGGMGIGDAATLASHHKISRIPVMLRSTKPPAVVLGTSR